MTERGLPIVDGAPACPFVAFEDDREERATSPDSRHRCFAEVRPAPRALAHQVAYCLTNAFGICPTFQDWARRESARVRDDLHAREVHGARDPGGAAPPPPARDARPAAAAPFPEEPVRRNPQRGWAAPPPWMGSFEDDPAPSRGSWGRAGPDDPAPREFTSRRADAGLAGSLAHRIAMDAQPADPGPSRPAPPSRPQRTVEEAPPPGRDARAAARAAQQAAQQAARRAGDDDELDDEAGEDGDEGGGSGPGARQRLGSIGASAGTALSRVGSMVPRGRPAVSQVSRPARPTRRDPAAPPWERPVRYEAYPTLRTRMGMPAIPRLVVIFAALLLAAGGLFLLPGLLGLGAPKATPTPLPVPSRSAGPTFSFAPSPTPGPTFVTYVVQPGDTMSKIAARFGVPLTMLIEANKDKYPNPDRIAAGDTLIIPSALPSAFKDATVTKAPTKSP